MELEWRRMETGLWPYIGDLFVKFKSGVVTNVTSDDGNGNDDVLLLDTKYTKTGPD